MMRQLTPAFQAVADAYTTDLAEALQARDWDRVTGMLTPEFTEAVKSKDWTAVGDEYGDLDGAYLIRAALLGSIDSEAAILDAIKRGNDGDLDTVRSMQNQRRAAIVNDGDSKVGLP